MCDVRWLSAMVLEAACGFGFSVKLLEKSFESRLRDDAGNDYLKLQLRLDRRIVFFSVDNLVQGPLYGPLTGIVLVLPLG
jgi:hypothetical protein